MVYHATIEEHCVAIRCFVEDKDFLGDAYQEIFPGEMFYYLTYDELVAAGEGSFQLDTSRIQMPDTISEHPRE